ncbi:MAG: TonB-dependent receptor [Gemmatimonadetes bacterium]|jgi:ferric enterobactin receptor|nr:TonB-dependent receptor [Gemmatimonadota bacterium]
MSSLAAHAAGATSAPRIVTMTRSPVRLCRLLCAGLTLAATMTAPAHAQASGAPPRAPSAGPGEIRGRITEIGTGRGIGSGSITVRRGADSSFVSGALPGADGSFRVEGLAPGRYSVRIRALGFAPVVHPAEVTMAQPVVDLGAVVVSHVSAQQLAGQEIVAEREDVALAPDRNSYSTKNMATASGGTAVDVLRNVPSVEVDGTNNVSLRGNSNVVVQINGRPSPLKGEQLGNFLAQLPASAVKNVEVATNPSAKNDPEGTAGIINIVLNQEAELGLSGGFTAGTGTTGAVSLSGNVGKQQGPLIVLVSGNFFRDSRAMSGTTARTNLAVPRPAFVDGLSAGTQKPFGGGMTLRSEYRFSKLDALSFDAMAFGGRFGGSSLTAWSDYDAARNLTARYDQFTDNAFRNNSQDYTLAFRRTAPPTASSLSSELRYSNNANTGTVNLNGTLLEGDLSTLAGVLLNERDATIGHFPSWSLQTDLTRPLGTGTKLETGFKGTARHTANDFSAAYLDPTIDEYVAAPARASAFDYRERIGAVYGVLSRQVDKAQLQAGLRGEEAASTLGVATLARSYDKHYGSVFPSAIASWNFTAMRQAKISYSRRITRPDPFQLSPIENRYASRAVFRGNPALNPEYTNALELGLQEARGWGSVQLNPYLRRSTSAVRFISFVDSTGVTVSTFDNVASTTTLGTDLNVNVRHGALTLFGGGSAYRYSSDARNLSRDLSARAFVWALRGNLTYKASPLTDVQLFANYRAPQVTEGGRQDAFVFMNAALRHKLWGEQGNIALRVADPFNLMKFGSRTESLQAVELSERRFGQRGVFLTITRNFGQQLKLRPRQDDQPQGPPTPGGPP